MAAPNAGKKELTDMQKAFVEALFSDEAKGNPTIAKKMAGYADSIKSNYLLSSLSDEIIDAAKKYLGANSAKAVFAVLDTMQNGHEAGSAVRLKAATEILQRAGVKEKEDQMIGIPESGLVILPAKKINIKMEEEE